VFVLVRSIQNSSFFVWLYKKGIKVRPLEGIAGVDYLAPGSTITESISFVFGPVVRILKGVGYTDDNMVAAPYDWRIPPAHLEKRDGYYTKLMRTIETMVKRNGRKVVILSHSMGYRTAHYFLKFTEVSSSCTVCLFVVVGSFYQ